VTAHEIYAVSTGSYSDYGVRAIFARREDAEVAISGGYLADSSDKPEIEEFSFYAAGELPKRSARITYHADVEIADGSVAREWSYPRDEWMHPSEKPGRTETHVSPTGGGPNRMHLSVHGPAGKRTHKVYTDALAKLRAECVEGVHSHSAPERRLP
jgi:hypothetical protein